MNLLTDVINYVRRIVKTPSTGVLTDGLILDYVNRFWINDVSSRIQLFDMKRQYTFTCKQGVTSYNAPMYSISPYAVTDPSGVSGATSPGYYPVYQGFEDPCTVMGISVSFYTNPAEFHRAYPIVKSESSPVTTGDGTASYTFSLPSKPALRGNIDYTGVIAIGAIEDPITGSSLDTSVPLTSLKPEVFITAKDSNNFTWTVTDSGQFQESNENIGFLQAVNGTTIVSAGTVNYDTGDVSVTFPAAIPTDNEIRVSSTFFQQGIPRTVLFYNNVITVFPPPNVAYAVEMTGYLSPAAFLTTSDALPFAYMAEYIARGAARKILSDTGDLEQFNFYEPLFKEQEMLVWKRSQRQFTATRTPTIFSQAAGGNYFGNSSGGI